MTVSPSLYPPTLHPLSLMIKGHDDGYGLKTFPLYSDLSSQVVIKVGIFSLLHLGQTVSPAILPQALISWTSLISLVSSSYHLIFMQYVLKTLESVLDRWKRALYLFSDYRSICPVTIHKIHSTHLKQHISKATNFFSVHHHTGRLRKSISVDRSYLGCCCDRAITFYLPAFFAFPILAYFR